MNDIYTSRRATTLGFGATAAMSSAPEGAFAEAASNGAARPNGPSRRGRYHLKGGYILTMEAATGDIAVGDVIIDNGSIVAVGVNLRPPADTETVDAKGMLVLPGFIDTHTHLWPTQLRGRFGGAAGTRFFPERNLLAPSFQPQDCYQGELLGAAESVYSGITTSVDFFHNNIGPDHVRACLDALKVVGQRCRFLFGPSTATPPTQTTDLRRLEALSRNWSETVGDAPLTLGLGWRTPTGIMKPGEPIPPDLKAMQEEFDVARGLKLPISVHVAGPTARQQFEALVRGNFLGPDVQLVHFTNAQASDIKLAAEGGSPVALTPLVELRLGYGIPQLGDFLDGGMKVGLGIDSNSAAGASNMFAVMKIFQVLENGRLKNELGITARRLLELATIEGARSIGLDSQIGSIKVGKRADIIMIDTNAFNMGMFAADPTHLIVEAGAPANVDSVWVDGRPLKRQGRMTGINERAVVSEAQRSMADVLDRVGKK